MDGRWYQLRPMLPSSRSHLGLVSLTVSDRSQHLVRELQLRDYMLERSDQLGFHVVIHGPTLGAYSVPETGATQTAMEPLRE